MATPAATLGKSWAPGIKVNVLRGLRVLGAYVSWSGFIESQRLHRKTRNLQLLALNKDLFSYDMNCWRVCFFLQETHFLLRSSGFFIPPC